MKKLLHLPLKSNSVKKILVIDDIKPNLIELELDGIDVTYFDHAEMAYTHILEGENKWKYDLVLIDEELDNNKNYFDGSGTLFGKMLNTQFSFIPLVMVTAARFDAEKSVEALAYCGFTFFLNKSDFYRSPTDYFNEIKELQSYKNCLKMRAYERKGMTMFFGDMGNKGYMEHLLIQYRDRPNHAFLEDRINVKALNFLFEVKVFKDAILNSGFNDHLSLYHKNKIPFATKSFKLKGRVDLDNNLNFETLEDKLIARRVFIGYTFLYRDNGADEFNLDNLAALVQKGDSNPVTKTGRAIYRGSSVYNLDLGLFASRNQIVIRGNKITPEEDSFITTYLDGFRDLLEYVDQNYDIENYHSLSDMLIKVREASEIVA